MLALIFLIAVAPNDKQLGSILKVIYLHGAVTLTGVLLFSAVGAVSLLSLLRKGDSTFSLLFALEKTTIIFWFASFVLGSISSKLAWGGVLWSEPRFKATIIILLLSISVYFISTTIEGIVIYLGLGLSISVWALLLNAGRVLHPENPFLASENLIQVFFIIITVICIVISVLMVRWMMATSKNTGS
jgi:ABC-type transport system involved in cytochrome c biogenesis permease subunit